MPPADTASPAATVRLTTADIALAHELIKSRTMTLPGLGPGTRMPVGPGLLTTADRLVLFALKANHQANLCLPGTWFLGMLERLDDASVHKKAAELFWNEYSQSTACRLDRQEGDLRSAFGWYLDTKVTERLKRSNQSLGTWLRSEEVWRRAVEAERQWTERLQGREEEGRLARDSYLNQWEAEDKKWQAEAAERAGEQPPDKIQIQKDEALKARQKAETARRRLEDFKEAEH